MATQPISQNPLSHTGATGNSGSTSSSSSGTDIEATFLNLLITELKSQDPTAPMDADQMVGQMVSLNQLDQLISIHQILQSATNTSSNSTNPSQGGH